MFELESHLDQKILRSWILRSWIHSFGLFIKNLHQFQNIAAAKKAVTVIACCDNQ